jgi:hypothetical protein
VDLAVAVVIGAAIIGKPHFSVLTFEINKSTFSLRRLINAVLLAEIRDVLRGPLGKSRLSRRAGTYLATRLTVTTHPLRATPFGMKAVARLTARRVLVRFVGESERVTSAE